MKLAHGGFEAGRPEAIESPGLVPTGSGRLVSYGLPPTVTVVPSNFVRVKPANFTG